MDNSEKLKGIIVLDKPAGITSFQTCEKVMQKLNVEKAGHAGTLDHDVTGVFVIALNNSVKAMPILFHLDKTYEGTAHLHKDIEKQELEQAIKKFIGKIIQLPPRRSRVKRQERQREIYDFKLIEKKDKDFKFSVHCEAGTYIRKLIHDLGIEFGGAHMTQLRRTQQGPFTEKDIVTLENLSPKNIIPLEQVIKKLKVPIIEIEPRKVLRFKQGRYIKMKEKKIPGTIVVFSQGKVIALATLEDNLLKPKRIIDTE